MYRAKTCSLGARPVAGAGDVTFGRTCDGALRSTEQGIASRTRAAAPIAQHWSGVTGARSIFLLRTLAMEAARRYGPPFADVIASEASVAKLTLTSSVCFFAGKTRYHDLDRSLPLNPAFISQILPFNG